jgi:hypothetical protein
VHVCPETSSRRGPTRGDAMAVQVGRALATATTRGHVNHVRVCAVRGAVRSRLIGPAGGRYRLERPHR